MDFELKSPDEHLALAFSFLRTRKDVAHLLEIEEKSLIYYLYRMPEKDKYISFEIPKKSGGTRTITSPQKSIKILQRKLYQVFKSVYKPKQCVHGFVENRSIVTNASQHKNQRYVFNFDLKDFFPSINFGRVRGMLMAEPYNVGADASTILAQICCFNNEIPQGAPTSPIIANMICSKLDSQLQQLARENKCYYTRFADDITFSTSLAVFPSSIAVMRNEIWEMGEEIQSIVQMNGFEIQLNKVRMQERFQSQVVTGLTVNEFPNVSRKYVRQIRAMLHDWDVNGYEAAQEKHLLKREFIHRNPENPVPKFKEVVQGKISFLKMVRDSDYQEDEIYTRFLDKLNYLIERDGFGLSPESDVSDSKIFISYAHKDDKFMWKLYHQLNSFGESIWVDRKSIRNSKKWNDEIQTGLNECDIMILVVSPAAMKSKNVADEWQFFHARNKPIIPILLYGSHDILHYQLQAIQWIDFRKINQFVSKIGELRKTIQDIRIELETI